MIYLEITTNPRIAWSASVVKNEVIDRINILQATHLAMRRAVEKLSPPPEHVLIDGLPVRPFPAADRDRSWR